MSVASSQLPSAGRTGRAPWRVIACAALSVCVWSAAAVAQAASFSYTGGEQAYTVPAGVSRVQITAIGGAGGRPADGSGLPAGRGAIVTGVVAVRPGQVLYVYVGGAGGLPGGGFNGGGAGGSLPEGGMAWGGGGASDVSTNPGRSASSLESRVIVAAGGGGSGGIGAAGGDAGAPGGCCGAAGTGPYTAQPGTQTAGGAGGCNSLGQACGGSGGLGLGGDGGASGTAEDARTGSGGGGGLYGGGGGAGHVVDNGAGAGGSSLVPSGGSVGLAPHSTPTGVDVTPYTPPARCADGLDNDGDRLTDFAADPGCSSATDDDEANPFAATRDTVAPSATLTGRRTQKLGRTIAATVKCGATEDCIVSATGRLAIRGSARRGALKAAKRTTVSRSRRVTLKLGVPVKARAAATRALRRQTKVYATVTVTVADAAGNARTLKRRIRIVR